MAVVLVETGDANLRIGTRGKGIVEGPNGRIWIGYYYRDTTVAKIAYSDDGGQTWIKETLPAGAGAYKGLSIACLESGLLLIVGVLVTGTKDIKFSTRGPHGGLTAFSTLRVGAGTYTMWPSMVYEPERNVVYLAYQTGPQQYYRYWSGQTSRWSAERSVGSTSELYQGCAVGYNPENGAPIVNRALTGSDQANVEASTIEGSTWYYSEPLIKNYYAAYGVDSDGGVYKFISHYTGSTSYIYKRTALQSWSQVASISGIGLPMVAWCPALGKFRVLLGSKLTEFDPVTNQWIELITYSGLRGAPDWDVSQERSFLAYVKADSKLYFDDTYACDAESYQRTFSIGASLDDFFILGEDNDFETARSTSSFGSYDNIVCQVGANKASTPPYYLIHRAFLRFDTASLPANAGLQRARLYYRPTAYAMADGSASILIKDADWSAYTSDPEANREALYDLALDAPVEANAFWDTSIAVAQSWISSYLLDLDWISKTGYTYYALVHSRDQNTQVPAGGNYLNFYSFDYGTGQYRPLLAVTFILLVGQVFQDQFEEGICVGDEFFPLEQGQIWEERTVQILVDLDFWISGLQNSDWAITRANSSTLYDTETLMAQAKKETGLFGIGRAFLRFDTSSLPVPDDIIEAKLHYYVTNAEDDGSANQEIFLSMFDWSLYAGDPEESIETLYDGALVGPFDSAIFGSCDESGTGWRSSEPVDKAWLKASEDGYVYYALLHYKDRYNSPPDGINSLIFSSGETANKPYLEVTYKYKFFPNDSSETLSVALESLLNVLLDLFSLDIMIEAEDLLWKGFKDTFEELLGVRFQRRTLSRDLVSHDLSLPEQLLGRILPVAWQERIGSSSVFSGLLAQDIGQELRILERLPIELPPDTQEETISLEDAFAGLVVVMLSELFGLGPLASQIKGIDRLFESTTLAEYFLHKAPRHYFNEAFALEGTLLGHKVRDLLSLTIGLPTLFRSWTSASFAEIARLMDEYKVAEGRKVWVYLAEELGLLDEYSAREEVLRLWDGWLHRKQVYGVGDLYYEDFDETVLLDEEYVFSRGAVFQIVLSELPLFYDLAEAFLRDSSGESASLDLLQAQAQRDLYDEILELDTLLFPLYPGALGVLLVRLVPAFGSIITPAIEARLSQKLSVRIPGAK